MDKLKSLLGYVIAVIIILAGAYYSGFLTGFTPKDFQDAYNRLSNSINNSAIVNHADIKTTSGHNAVKTYNNYHPNLIDKQVITGSETTGAWSNIFKSSKKTVFYLYDTNDNYHTEISRYISSNHLDRYYNIIAYSKQNYSNYSVGNASYAKICNSLQECKAQRDRAATYTKLAQFMESCGKTLCVINGSNKQFIRLYKRDVNEAKKLLEGVKLW